MSCVITDFRYDMTAIKIRDDILDNTPNTKVKSKRNLSVDLKRMGELGSKRNVKLHFVLFWFDLHGNLCLKGK